MYVPFAFLSDRFFGSVSFSACLLVCFGLILLGRKIHCKWCLSIFAQGLASLAWLGQQHDRRTRRQTDFFLLQKQGWAVLCLCVRACVCRINGGGLFLFTPFPSQRPIYLQSRQMDGTHLSTRSWLLFRSQRWPLTKSDPTSVAQVYFDAVKWSYSKDNVTWFDCNSIILFLAREKRNG